MSLVAITRSETAKVFTTSAWWILSIVLAVYIGLIAAGLAAAVSAVVTGALGAQAPGQTDGLAPVVYSTATSIGYVFPLLIGTLLVTAEYRHQTLTPTFLAAPRRGAVLAGKMLAAVFFGVLFAVVALAAAVVPGAAVLAGFGVSTGLDMPEIWAQLGRSVLAFVLWTLVGLGVGALVRNQVGAIVGVLVITQFVEPVARVAAIFVEGTAEWVRVLPSAAGDALVGSSIFSAVMPDETPPLEWWVAGLALLGYAAVLNALGALVSWRRDVT